MTQFSRLRPRARRAGLAAAASIAALCAFASPLAAETVRVGAGEHDGFSRLVLNMDPPAGWRVEIIEIDGAPALEIRLPGVSADFDVRAVTSRWRAHRVNSFERVANAEGVILRFGLNCQCAVRARAEAEYLVFDLAEAPLNGYRLSASDGGPAASGSAAPTPASNYPTAPPPTAALSAAVAAVVMGPEGTPDRAASADPTASVGDGATLDTASIVTNDLRDPEIEGATTQEERVALARRRLEAQLRRAESEGYIRFRDDAENGLVDNGLTTPGLETADAAPAQTGNMPGATPTLDAAGAQEQPSERLVSDSALAEEAVLAADRVAPPSPLSADAPDVLTADRPSAAAPAQPQTPQALAENIIARAEAASAEAEAAAADGMGMGSGVSSGMSSEMGSSMGAAPTTAARAACLPNTAFGSDAWGDSRAFPAALAAMRSGLIDSLNRVNAAAVERLMSYYLSHGFGHEAFALAQAFEVDTPRARLYADIGAVLARRRPSQDSPLLRVEPCEGRHGLWQALAHAESAPELAMAAYRASGANLAFMPEPLRRMIGGRLARAAIAAGDVALATDILSLLLRSSGPINDDMRMAHAEIMMAEGRNVAARESFEAVIAANGPDASEAMMRLATLLEAPHQQRKAERLADDLADEALKHRGHGLWAPLIDAEARLRARFGDIAGAIAVYDRAIARADRIVGRLVREEAAAAEDSGVDSDAALTAARTARAAMEANALALRAGKRGLADAAVREFSNTRATEDAVNAVDLVARLGPTPEDDQTRLRLARVLIAAELSSYVPVVLTDAVQARSREALALVNRAERRARLVDPVEPTDPILSAEVRRAAAEEAEAQAAAEAAAASAAGLETADWLSSPEAVEQARFQALESYASGADAPPRAVAAILADADDAETPIVRGFFQSTTSEEPLSVDEGKTLVNELEAEIDYLREMTSR